MEFAGFDWDDSNRDKVRSQGVSIAEIEGLFSNFVKVAPDPTHSAQEERIKALGGRPMDELFSWFSRHGARQSKLC